jgi:hypothetical protein
LLIYAIFFFIEVAGMVLILWDGIPIFRQLINFQQVTTERDAIILLVAVALVQFTYWKRLRHDPPFDLPRQQLAAHILLFASRLSFIFASSIFSFVVYRYSDVFELARIRSLLMMAVLFSVFCFTRHLEKIGNLMLTGRKAPDRSRQTNPNGL